MFLLQLRTEQMMTLSVVREQEFQRRLAEHLRKHCRQATRRLADEELHRRVELGINRARRNGFVSERGIVSFVSLMFLLGPKFDRHPTVSAVLRDYSLKGDERLEVLPSRLSERDWRQLVQSPASDWNKLT